MRAKGGVSGPWDYTMRRKGSELAGEGNIPNHTGHLNIGMCRVMSEAGQHRCETAGAEPRTQPRNQDLTQAVW